MMNRKIMMAVFCFIVAGAALIGTAAADTGSLTFYEAGAYTPFSFVTGAGTAVTTQPVGMGSMYFKDIGEYQGTLFSIEIEAPNIFKSGIISSECDFSAKIGTDEIGNGILFYTSRYNNESQQTGCNLIFYFRNWNAAGYDGTQTVSLTYSNDPDSIGTMTTTSHYKINNPWTEAFAAVFSNDYGLALYVPGYYVSWIKPDNNVQVVIQTASHDQSLSYYTLDPDLYSISFERNGISNEVIITGLYDGFQYYHKTSDEDFSIYGSDVNYQIFVENIAAGADWDQTMLSGTEAPEDPTDNDEYVAVTTSNIVSGANIPASLNFTEGSNSTVFNLASGYASIELAKETSYNVTATATGYEQLDGIIWFDDSTAITVNGDSGYITRTGSVSTGNLAYNFKLEPTYSGEDGNVSIYNVVVTGEGAGALSGAGVTVSGVSTKVANSAGGAQFTLQKYTPYSVTVSYTGFQSFTYPINLSTSTFTDYITLQLDPTGPYATPTPTPAPGETGDNATIIDLRTANQKAEDALDIWFDNAETISALAVLVVLISMIGWLVPKKRR